MTPAPHRPSRRRRRHLPICSATALASFLPALRAPAVPVSWSANVSAPWSSTSFWSTHTLPGPTDDVTIDRPNGTYTITLSSGTQSINSLTSNENLSVSGGTLAVSTTAQIGGSLSLGSGTLSGGTYSTTAAGTFAATGGTLNAVTLASNLSLSNGTLTLTNGLTLAGGTLTVSPSSNISPLLNFTGPQTLAGNGTVLFNTYGNIYALTGGLTIAPAITVTTGPNPANLYLGNAGLNQGTIAAQATGQTLSVIGTYWTNAGTLAASNGGTLRIDTNGDWTNSGTISVAAGSSASLNESWTNTGSLVVDTGGKLTLGGTFSPSSIANLNNHGSVSITGTLVNTNHTFTLDSPSLSLTGGTLVGGTLATPPAGANAYGTLKGVTLTGNINVPIGSLALTYKSSFAGGSVTLATSTSLPIDSGQFVGGTGSVLFAGFASVTTTGYITLGPGVTFANTGAATSGTGSINLGSYSITQATISSQLPGRTISVTGTSWENDGPLAASNGGTLSLGGTWTNAGTVTAGPGGSVSLAPPSSNTGSFNVAPGGKLTLLGSVTPASLGTLNNNGTVILAGSLDNTGNTLTLDDSSFSVVGGTVTGGTINTPAAGATLYGELHGVTLAGKLSNNGDLILAGGLTLAGGTLGVAASTPRSIQVSGAQTIAGTGTILFGSGAGNFDGVIDAPFGSLTLAPGITVTTGPVAAGWLNLGGGGVNQGTISAKTPGRSLLVFGSNWTNAGAISASNGGNLTIGGPWSNTGSLSVDPGSTLVFSNNITPNGTISLAGNALLNYTTTSPADALRQQLALGRAGVTGIIRPQAAADPTLAIGYAEASLLLGLTGTKTAKWSGQTVDATTLLLQPTPYGDANLDGTVNADDYALLDRALAKSPANPHWTDGDFNYDGMINNQDYLLIDATFLKAQGSSPGFLEARESQFGPTYVSQLLASLPEPTSALACLLATLPLLSRKRRPS